MRIIDRFAGRPSAIKGMLWSLVLHATAVAATYGWWSSFIAPPPISDAVFAGNRHVVQIEATFSEVPTEQEIETVLEIDSIAPLEKLSPAELPQLQCELVVAPPSLRLPDIPLQDNPLQENDAEKTIELKPPSKISLLKEPHETEPVATPKKPPSQPVQPPMRESVAVVEQFAGIEETVPPDFTGNRPPSYPPEAIRRRLEGVVLLRIHVSASGYVEQVEIVKSSGHAILDRSAVEAVRTWHARPAEQQGKLVATVEILPIRFQL